MGVTEADLVKGYEAKNKLVRESTGKDLTAEDFLNVTGRR